MCLLSVWMRDSWSNSSQPTPNHVDTQHDGIAVSVEPLIRFPSSHPALSIRFTLENTSKRLLLHFWSIIPTRGTGILSITLPSWTDSTTDPVQESAQESEGASGGTPRGPLGVTDLPDAPYAALESINTQAGGLVLCERIPLTT